MKDSLISLQELLSDIDMNTISEESIYELKAIFVNRRLGLKSVMFDDVLNLVYHLSRWGYSTYFVNVVPTTDFDYDKLGNFVASYQRNNGHLLIKRFNVITDKKDSERLTNTVQKLIESWEVSNETPDMIVFISSRESLEYEMEAFTRIRSRKHHILLRLFIDWK